MEITISDPTHFNFYEKFHHGIIMENILYN